MPKGRGRPPKYPKKSSTPEPVVTPRAKRGRKPKSETAAVDTSFLDEDIIDPSPSSKKRHHDDDEDDEYTGDEEEEEEEEDDDDEAAEEADVKPPSSIKERGRPRGRRGRKPKVQVKEEVEDDVDEDEEEEEANGEAGDDAEAEDAEGQEPEVRPGSNGTGPEKQPRKIPKKRGRKKIKLIPADDGFLDEDGNSLQVVDDEIVMENEDPLGQAKVEKNGELIGDRVYRMKTFTLLGKGDKLYMVSTEPARLVGFRDSYLLFKTHKWLFKKVCTHEEKMDLINRHIIPNSYKGRSVNLVTARSIFREFGARIIKDGRKITDDFWEKRARDRGDVEGEYADPAELYSNKHMTSGLGYGGPGAAEGSANGTPPVGGVNSAALASSAHVKYQTDPTWMYQIVMQTIAYNRKLQDDRTLAFRGIKDTYTGLNFYPESTQSTRALVTKLSEIGSGAEESEASGETLITNDIVYYNPDITRKSTGLKNVPLSIFDDLEDEDIKKAILEQQAFEKSL